MTICTEQRMLCREFLRACEAVMQRGAYSSRSINKGRTYRVSFPFDTSLRYTSWKGKITPKQIARADELLNALEKIAPSGIFITYDFHVGAFLYISFRMDVKS